MSAEPMKRTICPPCQKFVEDYEPGVSSVFVDGVQYHPQCAPEFGADQTNDLMDGWPSYAALDQVTGRES